MRCEAVSRSGVACGRAAMRGAGRCASHTGRCGARRGNRNAVRHGLYSHSLSAEERLRLAAANRAEGLEQEIAVTRLMIARALHQPDVPPAAYAQLVHALCRLVRLQRQLAREADKALDGEISALFDAAATELGLGAEVEPDAARPDGGDRPAPGRRSRRRRAGVRSVRRRRRVLSRRQGAPARPARRPGGKHGARDTASAPHPTLPPAPAAIDAACEPNTSAEIEPPHVQPSNRFPVAAAAHPGERATCRNASNRPPSIVTPIPARAAQSACYTGRNQLERPAAGSSGAAGQGDQRSEVGATRRRARRR
jgi:hypothetical protein